MLEPEAASGRDAQYRDWCCLPVQDFPGDPIKEVQATSL